LELQTLLDDLFLIDKLFRLVQAVPTLPAAADDNNFCF